MLRNFILVALGGAFGAVSRYAVILLTGKTNFPFATLAVNISGSLLIGLLFGLGLGNTAFENQWKLLLATGVCGGFTTFSAFSLENLEMLREGNIFLLLLYVTVSILGGLLATWLGFKIVS